MKSFQISYDNVNSLKKQLSKIKTKYIPDYNDNIIFHITWTNPFSTQVKAITDCIELIFPGAVYCGNEGSGNISVGKFTDGISITCDIFDDANSKIELLWVEENTAFSSLKDLWIYCNKKESLKAVELLPSMSYIESLSIDNNITDIDENILIFGGCSIDLDAKGDSASVIALGHPMTENGMPVILYYGDNLNVSGDYIIGWKGLGRYMRVSKTDGKILYELDNQPACSIYEKYLGMKDDDSENLIFPLIIEDEGYEYIRTPQVFLPDKSMKIVMPIQEGSYARIAYGDKNTILSSLYEKAVEINKFQPQVLRAFSCAARKLFWGDDEISKETLPLQNIAPINGFYTGGEILNFGHKLRVLNETLVVVSFREGKINADNHLSPISFEKNDKSLLSRITHFVEVVSNEQKEALNVANEEKLRNDLIHDIIHSGKWSIQLDENDNYIKTDCSDDIFQIIDNDTPKDLHYWLELIHPDDKKVTTEAFLATIADRTSNTPYDVTYRMRSRNNEYYWFHSAGRIIRDENGNAEFFGIHINITDQIERQLKQQKQLENALKMADSANNAKTEFLFNMSHDIRTPMTAILGFTNMAIKHIDNKQKAKDCLTKIQQASDLLLSLINNVLEVSKIESGKAEIEEQPGDINYCFTGIIDTMLVMAESKDIKLSFEFGDITHRYIYCDINRCERIFVNIISNAIKYTKEGGIVNVKCEEIESDKAEYAVFRYTFSDNGIGMSDEFQKHVFEQFSREKSVTKTGIQGTGLGMAMCKSYVELMQGKIECQSKLGEGTTFIVTVPLKIQENSLYADSNTLNQIDYDSTSAHRKVSYQGKRLLLTEDNELNREIAYDILDEKGFIIDEAVDGSVAVNLLKEKGPDYYDVILMDIQMPIMNGYEATKEIRKLYPESNIPIIALSANAFKEDKAASIAAGMNDHIAKPINIQELFAVLERYF